MVSNPKKLQHQMTTDITLAGASEFVDNATSDRDAGPIRSIYGLKIKAGAWLNTIPTSDKNTLKPSEFCLASYLRIGQPLKYSKWITTCDCGAEINEHGYHLLTCKYGDGPVWENNSSLSTWSNCLSES